MPGGDLAALQGCAEGAFFSDAFGRCTHWANSSCALAQLGAGRAGGWGQSLNGTEEGFEEGGLSLSQHGKRQLQERLFRGKESQP